MIWQDLVYTGSDDDDEFRDFEDRYGENFGGNDLVSGGGGNDWLGFGMGNDTLYGGDGNDTLGAGHGDNRLYGDAGDDVVISSKGADAIYGGAGNDILAGGRDNDIIDCGDGNDTVFGAWGEALGYHQAESIDGADGDDVVVWGDQTGWSRARMFFNTSTLTKSDVAIDFNTDGSLTARLPEYEYTPAFDAFGRPAGYEAHVLPGTVASTQTIRNVELFQFADGTWTYEQLLADYMAAHPGFALDPPPVSEPASPADPVVDLPPPAADAGTGTPAPAEPTPSPAPTPHPQPKPAHGEIRRGGGGNDTISGHSGSDRLYGNAGADRMAGAGGNDTVSGGTGQDSLAGGAGSDQLAGGAGRDRLNGGAGADTIDGGRGADTLTGGTGADHFVMNARSGYDRITDWQDGVDRIDLRTQHGVHSFGDIAIRTCGADAIVSNSEMLIRVVDAAGLIDASDFLFAI